MKAPVFYSPRMSADSGGYSPSAAKPSIVVDAWKDAGFPIEIRVPMRATLPMLDRAHDPQFVREVLDGRRANGHGNTSFKLAATLPYTCGAMTNAAAEAIANGKGAVAPVSGFHHAGYDFAGGFCTFNGLMVAALNVQANEVGILDFDMHYGNGTDDIMDQIELTRPAITHYSQGKYPDPTDAERWLAGLPELLQRFVFCDVVLYQAGQDPHIDDPLGGWLTTDQLYHRDKIVFEELNKMGVPVAWNLAGGYQKDFKKVIDGHVNTMKAFCEVYGWE